MARTVLTTVRAYQLSNETMSKTQIYQKMSDVNKKNFVFTPAHCRSARGLLDLTQRQLADAAGVSLESLRLFEKNERRPHESTLARVMDAFERRGIEFLNGGSPGVRLHPERSMVQ